MKQPAIADPHDDFLEHICFKTNRAAMTATAYSKMRHLVEQREMWISDKL